MRNDVQLCTSKYDKKHIARTQILSHTKVLFIEFDDLTQFQKICMIIHVYKIEFPCVTIFYMGMGIYDTDW